MRHFVCPRCEYLNEIGALVAPTASDLRVCLACAAVLAWQPDGPPRWLTIAEVTALPREVRAHLANAVLVSVSIRPSTIRHREPAHVA
jgi:hypothetical protein